MDPRRVTPSAAPSPQVKRVDGGVGYGGDWTVRIAATEAQGQGTSNESPRRVSLLFYVANEDVRAPADRSLSALSRACQGARQAGDRFH